MPLGGPWGPGRGLGLPGGVDSPTLKNGPNLERLWCTMPLGGPWGPGRGLGLPGGVDSPL
jgi:hypothetical protein